jgi:hypothetical protein
MPRDEPIWGPNHPALGNHEHINPVIQLNKAIYLLACHGRIPLYSKIPWEPRKICTLGRLALFPGYLPSFLQSQQVLATRCSIQGFRRLDPDESDEAIL